MEMSLSTNIDPWLTDIWHSSINVGQLIECAVIDIDINLGNPVLTLSLIARCAVTSRNIYSFHAYSLICS